MKSRFLVVEKYQLQDAAAFGQLDLLGHDVQHMAVIALHFFHPVSARFQIGEQNLAQAVGLISADKLRILVYFKGDVRQSLMGLPVILDDPKAGFGTVLQSEGNGVLPWHIDGVSLAVLDPSIGGFQLHDLIGTGLQLIENSHTGFVGDLGVSGSAFDVLDLHLCAREGIAGVCIHLLHPQIAVRLVFIAHRGHSVLFHLYLLHRVLGHQVALGGLHLGNRVQTAPLQGHEDLAPGIGGKCPHRCAVRIFYFKQGPLQAGAGACFGLDDLQAVFPSAPFRRRGILENGVRPGGTHRVGVCNVVLQLPISTGLLANSIEGGVLVHIAFQQQLCIDAAADRCLGADHIKLPLVSSSLHRDLFDLLVLHIHDLHAAGHILAVKPDADLQAVHPGAALDGVDLLQVSLPIDLHLVGILLIWGYRQAGDEHIRPAAAPVINVLGGSKQPLGDLLLMLRKARGDGYFVDTPGRHQIAPQGHLGGIVGLLHIVQPQFFQAAVGISIAHNAHDLGVCGLILCQVFDGLPGAHRLGNTICGGVDTVGGDLLQFSTQCRIFKINIIQLLYSAIDGQVSQLLSAIVNTNFAQCFFRRICRQCCSREHPDQGNHKQQKRRPSSCFHRFLLFLLEFWRKKRDAFKRPFLK